MKNLRDLKGRFTSTKKSYKSLTPEKTVKNIKTSVEAGGIYTESFLECDLACCQNAGMSMHDVQVFLMQTEEGRKLLHPAEHA